jgi:uncharacterized membrane protein
VAGCLAGTSWSVALLAAWDAWAAVFLLWVWSTIVRKDPAATASMANDEDDSHTAAEATLLAAGVASLVAVAFTLAEAGRANEPLRGFLTGLVVASVLLAWAAVHTVYTLRYARLYYASPLGGIDFHDEDTPGYIDLAYVALTIGMTFQVSDTDITKKQIRRAAIHHALLSYLFGAVILAIVVNTVASLLGR